MIDGRLHHFSAAGLYDGLVLLKDDETGSYWHHITGEALHGALEGRRLEAWGVQLTTAGSALRSHPDLTLSRSRLVLWKRWLTRLAPGLIRGRGWLPPFFRGTMGEKDRRRPMMDHGLGVVVGRRARYYPLDAARNGVTDDWDGRPLRVFLDGTSHMPVALWEDDSRPFQIFTRWYGFAFSYPGCEIHGEIPLTGRR